MKKIYRILAAVLCFAVCVMLFAGCAATQGQTMSDVENGNSELVTLVTDQTKIPSIETVDPLLSEFVTNYIGTAIASDGYLKVLGSYVADDGEMVYRLFSFLPDGTGLTWTEARFPEANGVILSDLQENEVYLQLPLHLVDAGSGPLYIHWQTIRAAETEAGREIRKSTNRFGAYTYSSTYKYGGFIDNGEPFHGRALSDKSLAYLTATADTVWYESCGLKDPSAPRVLVGVSPQEAAAAFEVDLPENTTVISAQPLAGDRLLVQLTDIQVADSGYVTVDGSNRFYLLDLTQKKPKLGDPLPLPEGFLTNGTPILLNHDLSDLPVQASVYTPAGVYQWDVDAAVFTLLYSAESMGGGLTTAMNDAILYTDGTLCVPYQNNYDQPLRLRMFYPTDGARADDRQIITVGGDSIDEVLRQAADSFNWSNTEYRVKLLDYSDTAAAEAGYASGLEMLQRQLIQGEGPDVVLLSTSMSAGDMLNKGLFVDLYPLIDVDAELSREDLVPGLLTACEMDGTLPLVPPAFRVLTVVGSAQKLGPAMGWTWEEFNAATAGHPTPYYGFDRLTQLWDQLLIGGDQFIDYAAGKAYLDSPAFVQMLETSARYPAQMDYNADAKQKIAAGENLLHIVSCSDLNHVVPDTYYFDGPIVYKGFPTQDGGTGSAFTAEYQFGIRSTGENIEAAWSFVRTLLLPETQDHIAQTVGVGIPLRMDSIQKMMEEKQQDEQANYTIPSDIPFPPTPEQTSYFSRGLTQQECNDFMALILATDTMFRYDGAVYSIVFEEADAFYNGMRNAEEAAALIQSRVQTYLAEQG